MFTQANVTTNKKPNLRRRIDFTKVAPLGNAKKSPIFHCRYFKTTVNCQVRKNPSRKRKTLSRN